MSLKAPTLEFFVPQICALEMVVDVRKKITVLNFS
jgi:hypothetical protein